MDHLGIEFALITFGAIVLAVNLGLRLLAAWRRPSVELSPLSNVERYCGPTPTYTLADTVYDEDVDVGRCIIAGCPNWCEDTICSDHPEHRR
jgi:hypothetical protein